MSHTSLPMHLSLASACYSWGHTERVKLHVHYVHTGAALINLLYF